MNMLRTSLRLTALFSLALLLVGGSSVSAESRLPSVIFEVDNSQAEIVQPNGHTSNLIYLNKCEGGCTIYPGYDDSRTNTSSVVAGVLGTTAYISEFEHSQEDWDELVQCVTRTYEPFGIVVTDQDPGGASHFEAIVAGIDDEINYTAGGVAPGGCGFTNNAITFSFANQGSLSTLCWTVAQETAHAFGLDHVMECSDPMTYLPDCGYDKSFQDIDAPCGENVNRQCKCGGSTQNSFKLIRDHFGTGELTPPEVKINRPASGAVVKSNFPFEVGATDDIEVYSVEFMIDGVVVSELTSPPWVINAPDGLVGRVQVSARAKDNLGTESNVASVEVVIDDTLIQFGDACESNEDCEGSLCAVDSDGNGSCSQFCELEASENSCPSGTSCTAAGDQGVCWPGKESSSGMCSTSSASSWLSAFLVLFFVGLWRRRRVLLLRERP
jgi:hypothetical protein